MVSCTLGVRSEVESLADEKKSETQTDSADVEVFSSVALGNIFRGVLLFGEPAH